MRRSKFEIYKPTVTRLKNKNPMKKIIIGSRGSDLALWQAHFTQNALTAAGAKTEIKIIKTQGDKIQNLSFDKMEGKGFFTKEIEAALHEGSIDIAVHSHKDLETTNPEGLTVAAVSHREDPADLLVIRKNCVDKKQVFRLKDKPVVGTSSARRKAQFLHFRPDTKIDDIRGNVPTRLQKLRDGKFDAILLAAAGVKRLGIDMSEFEVHKMHVKTFVPAPAQGVLGIQIRKDDDKLYRLVNSVMNRVEVARCIKIEREVLRRFQGGCQMPLGVYCEKEFTGNFAIYAAYAKTWNSRVHFTKVATPVEEFAVDMVMKSLLREG